MSDTCIDSERLIQYEKNILLLISRIESLENEIDSYKLWRDKFMRIKRYPHANQRVESYLSMLEKSKKLAIDAESFQRSEEMKSLQPEWADHVVHSRNVLDAIKLLMKPDDSLNVYCKSFIIQLAIHLLYGTLPTCPDNVLDDIISKINHALSCVGLTVVT